MRINIAATHRFHLLDLARELQNLGHDVRFYSYVPRKRALEFGLRPRNCRSLLVLVAPLLAWVKLSKRSDASVKTLYSVMDFLLAKFMRPCDVYIALGTVYIKSFDAARQKFSARTIVEWGSKHIDEQQRILSEIPTSRNLIQSAYFVERSKSAYAIADYIAIPSDHVRLSFIEAGVAANKLIQNPYGVDLSMFAPASSDVEREFDLIMVGGWSYRKGCDRLIELCRTYGYTLLHVGSIVDIEFPPDSNMFHVDSVNQRELGKYYKRARVFILPSREEGLAMVQMQALACGLPVVCSPDTGGRDLRKIAANASQIIECKSLSIEDMYAAVLSALAWREQSTTPLEIQSDKMSWQEYGRRYSSILNKIAK